MSREDVERMLNLPLTIPIGHTFESDELDACCSATLASRVLRRWTTSRYMPPADDTHHPMWRQCYDEPLPEGYEPPDRSTSRKWLYVGDVDNRPGADPMRRDTWHLRFVLPVPGETSWLFHVPVGFMWNNGRPTEAWLAEQED